MACGCESDTNVTGGESLVRQLVLGKRFFLDELGVETEEVWLPDCFGYSAAFPQLILLSGSRWFLTQKLSWNDTNKFPHHTFWWEGIDGSRVFTHFPPVDTYNARLTSAELAHAASNYAEMGFGSRSMAPFGYGDGGGGPTREMMERARRLADLDGSPKVVVESPSKFFEAAHAEYANAPVWSGELYLELHRGTLTSQVEIKQGNRRSENLMREAELWSTAALIAGRSGLPVRGTGGNLARHLARPVPRHPPGQLHRYGQRRSHRQLRQQALQNWRRSSKERRWRCAAVAHCPFRSMLRRTRRDGVAALSAGAAVASSDVARVHDERILENDHIRVELDSNGHIVSLMDRVANREVIPPGALGNVLQLHPDIPNKWPAWDIDPFYRNTKTDLSSPESITVISSGPGRQPSGSNISSGSREQSKPCVWRRAARPSWWRRTWTGTSTSVC